MTNDNNFKLPLVADDDRGRYMADSSFYTGWKVKDILALDQLKIQVLLHDPVEFPEVNKKGTFVDIGKEVKQFNTRNVHVFIHFLLYNLYT